MRKPIALCRRESAAAIIRTCDQINRTRALTSKEADSLYQAIRDERRRHLNLGAAIAGHEADKARAR